MNRFRLILILSLVTMGVVLAQRFGGRRYGRFGGADTGIVYTEGGVPVDLDKVRTARETDSHSTGTPTWTNTPGFERDVCTFVRVIYRHGAYSSGSSSGGWITDFPDSDLNLSFRLQQVTSMRTDPDGRVLRLTDPALFDYPWIYMVEPGALEFKDEEVPILRKYLLNGGVLWADDFWGHVQWDNFEHEIKRALPERSFVELDMTHQIFHCVFDLKGPMNKLQTPNSRTGSMSRYDGVTWEYHDGEACIDMHVRAIFDDKGQIMVLATHNCDNGDGWEREGEDDYFFHEFSEKRAYPLGMNVIFYLMTH